MTEEAHALRELRAGIAFWRTHANWPRDFHNEAYEEWHGQNPYGSFTLDWWNQRQLPHLTLWKAIRPVRAQVLTSRFEESIPDLNAAWKVVCQPRLEEDISTVSWDEVAAFPNDVAKIKPMKAGTSAVFTSKFCHFLLPGIFPVVDNQALGNGWPSYESYFRCVQAEWAATHISIRGALTAELTHVIEGSGRPIYAGFPTINKIVELRLMGRRHPASPLRAKTV